MIISVRERCIPCFQVLRFSIAPLHALAVHTGPDTHSHELCSVPEIGLDSENLA